MLRRSGAHQVKSGFINSLHNMLGEIRRIISSGEFVTYIVRVQETETETRIGRTYTGETYRNYSHWKEFKVGDKIEGVKWKDRDRGIIDADSPVDLMDEAPA